MLLQNKTALNDMHDCQSNETTVHLVHFCSGLKKGLTKERQIYDAN